AVGRRGRGSVRWRLRDRTAPDVQLELRLGFGGVVTVAEERQLRLLAVPGQPLVAALAGQDRERRLRVAGRDGVDAVGFLLGARRDGVDEQPAVLAERVLHHVGDGLFVAVGEAADDQVAAELAPAAATALNL